MNLNDLDIARIDETCGDGEKSGEIDDNPARTLDAEDDAFDTLERPVDDADLLTFAELGRYVLEVKDFIGHDTADLHEVRHSLVGDGDGCAGRLVPHEMGMADLPHHVEAIPEDITCRVDKAEI